MCFSLADRKGINASVPSRHESVLVCILTRLLENAVYIRIPTASDRGLC